MFPSRNNQERVCLLAKIICNLEHVFVSFCFSELVNSKRKESLAPGKYLAHMKIISNGKRYRSIKTVITRACANTFMLFA